MRTFSNGNKGRSGPNAGKGRPGGNHFSGDRKPSPAGDGTGYRKRAGSGKSEGDAGHSRSYGGGNSGRGEDRPFNRSYSKTYDKSSRPLSRTDNPAESNGDSRERTYRGHEERPTGGSSNRSFGRPERPARDTNERPFRGRPERTGSGSSDRSFGRSERPSGDSGDRPYRGKTQRPTRDANDRPFNRSYGKPFDKDSRPASKSDNAGESNGESRPYRERSERSGSGSSDRSFERPARPAREFNEVPIYSKTDQTDSEPSERPFGRSEKPSRETNKKPYRGKPERTSGDAGDKPFKRSERSFRDQEEKPRRNRIEKPSDGSSDSPYKPERAAREAGERPSHKPSLEREGKSKPADRPPRESSDRPKRQSDSGKSVPFDDTMEMRINKYISNCGYCSRREADTLISAGAVKVNGVVVSELGSKVLPTDKVQIGEVTLSREASRYILLNKPKGYITTSDDPFDRKTVMSLVTNACRERIYPVGRLDRNTSGLLLFTNDGDLAKKLTHPKYGVRKVYHVGLDKALTKNDMIAISEGITLDDGLVGVDEIAYVNDDKKEIGIELHSGQNRVVRRIFESLGYEVEKLDRVIFANLTKKDLARGRWRLLEPHELNTLKMSL